jgi:hypothetical protein
MNRRITIAAVAVTLAAFGLSQSRLPATASLVGTYLAEGQASMRYVLTLNGDLSATLLTDSTDSGRPADLRGSWIIDAASVQVSLSGGNETTTLVLTLRDRSLVVTGSGSREALAGLVFERAAEPPSDNDPAQP